MAGKAPKLQWTPEELDALPPVYAAMIQSEHTKAVVRHKAIVQWEKANAKEEAEKGA